MASLLDIGKSFVQQKVNPILQAIGGGVNRAVNADLNPRLGGTQSIAGAAKYLWQNNDPFKAAANWQFKYTGGPQKGQTRPDSGLMTALKYPSQYVSGNYIQPLKWGGEGLMQAINPRNNLKTRLIGTGKAALSSMAMIPDPIQDTLLPAYQFLKGANLASNRGQGFKTNLVSGFKSASGEVPVGAGEVAFKNPTMQTVGNIAELPIMLFAPGITAKMRSKKLQESVGEIKRSLDLISANKIPNLKPDQWINNTAQIRKTAEKVIPQVVKSRDMRQLEASNPQLWQHYLGKFLQDAYITANNPERLLGASIRPLKEAPKPQSTVGGVSKKPIKVYFGSEGYLPDSGSGIGMSTTTDLGLAKNYAKEKLRVVGKSSVEEFTIKPEAKILKLKDLPNSFFRSSQHKQDLLNGKIDIYDALKKGTHTNETFDMILPKWAREHGYDVIDLRNNGLNESEYRILNRNVLTGNPNVAQPPKPQSTVGGVSDAQIKAPTQNQPLKLKAETKLDLTTEPGTQKTALKMQTQPQPSTTLKTSQLGTKQPSSVQIVPQKQRGKLNVDRLNLSDTQKQIVNDLQGNTPQTVLGNKEVVKKSAQTVGRTGVMTDEEMATRIAKQLNSRQTVVSLTEQLEEAVKRGAPEQERLTIMGQIAQASKVAKEEGTFAGRLLQARNIIANELATPMQRIFGLLDNAGVSEETYLKDAVKVDWNNATQVTAFYRKYVPPKLGEVMDEFRYTNMLSSPQTQINNAASNFIQTALVAPVEKTITGGLDWARSALTGKERQYYASQGIDYAKGYWKSLPEAWAKFKQVMSGGMPISRPDAEHIPISTKGFWKAYTSPLKLMEAGDQFFRTLTVGGEMASLKRAGQEGPAALQKAAQTAEYRLFRQAFDPEGKYGQNAVLKAWDSWNSAVMSLRRAPGGKWLVPFIRTPTNILKQGLEYSPAGLITVPGAKEPLVQLSKTLIGSAVFATAYGLAEAGLSTWDTPTNKKERELFYASGLQPYSLKIGDKWVSYSKLGPLSYPIAMAAALRHVSKTKPDESLPDKAAELMVQVLGFFGDQSYVKNIGDFVEALRGGGNKIGQAIQSQVANVAGQMVPYRSMLGWISRIIDPIYRDANTTFEKVVSQVPGLSETVPPYLTPSGEASKRDFPLLNAISPYKVTQEKPENASLYRSLEDSNIQKGILNREQDKLEEQDRKSYGQPKAVEDVGIASNDPLLDVKLSLAKDRVKLQGGVQQVGDFVVFKHKNETKTVDTGRITTLPAMPEETGFAELDKEMRSTYKSELSSIVNDVRALYETGQITADEAAAKMKEINDIYVGVNAKGKKPKKIAIKKSTPTKITIKKPRKINFKSLPKPKTKIVKSKGYKILTYKDESPKVKIIQPKMRWS